MSKAAELAVLNDHGHTLELPRLASLNTKPKGESETCKILCFSLSDVWYGIDVGKVVEVVGRCEIFPMPFVPDHILGVINLRGRVVPIIDLEKLFGAPEPKGKDNARIIIGRAFPGGPEVGIVCSSTKKIVEVPRNALEPVLATASRGSIPYLEGQIQLGDSIILLLNFEKLFEGAKVRKSASP